MKYSLLAVLACLPAALSQSSSASASGSMASGSSSGDAAGYLASLGQALTQANLTSLASVAQGIANTTEGMALLGELMMGNKTVFAPSNQAFMNVSDDVSSNTTLLTEILSYHILNNTYSANGTMTAPNHTIARTLLNMGGYQLPGNKSAPLVLAKMSKNATSFEIVQAASNVSTMGPVAAGNLMVYVIEEVLTLPPNVTAAAGELLPSLAGVLGQTNLTAPLEEAKAITVFAPNDAAFNAAMSALGQLNTTQITSILANHVINGSIVTSNELTTSNYTSAGGEPFKFMSNSSGAYVMSANSTAKIVQSDIIIKNGVVHVIDNILVNTGSNPSAAASAYQSGASAAATQMDPTGAQTSPPSMSSGGGSSGSSKPSGAGSHAVQLLSKGSVASIFFGGLAAVAGGALVML